MGDNWDDEPDEVVAKPKEKSNFSFNPKASSFSFNPSAASFGAPPSTETTPPAAPPPHAPPVTEERSDESADTRADCCRTRWHKTTTLLRHKLEQSGRSTDALSKATEELSVDSSSKATAPSAAPEASTPEPDSKDAPAESTAAVADDDDGEDVEDEEDKRKVWEILSKEDSRDHMNVVFIGHVDAGKSTLGGQILCIMGGVDERTIEKYQKEAKDNNRESWYMAYVMDTNDEERAKGKTVEVGRAHFQTDRKRYTILDAPGHKNYVPNMIQGASQADIGVLVISARKGEFETGYDRGGQTREHAQLAKTLGVAKLMTVINKMDDPSIVNADGTWNKERYDEIVSKLSPFLKQCGYNVARDVEFCPIAALTGQNVLEKVDAKTCSWWKGSTLFELLDAVTPSNRDAMAPFRMPIMDKYKDMGCVVMGKSESGIIIKDTRLQMMPNATRVKIATIWRDDDEVNAAGPGENLRVRLQGIDDDMVSVGFVLSAISDPCPVVSKFECALQLLDLLDHKSIFTAGYKSILHLHSLVEECEVIALIAEMDKKTKQKKKCKFAKSGATVFCRIATEKPICLETFDKNPQMGRFTLRDEGKTIAIGKVTKLPPASAK